MPQYTASALHGWVGWICFAAAVANAADDGFVPLQAWPAAGDYTTVSWLEGFPSRAAGAPWQRCIRTGHYAFVLDTETMSVPHMGSIEGDSFGAAVR